MKAHFKAQNIASHVVDICVHLGTLTSEGADERYFLLRTFEDEHLHITYELEVEDYEYYRPKRIGTRIEIVDQATQQHVVKSRENETDWHLEYVPGAWEDHLNDLAHKALAVNAARNKQRGA